MSAEIAGLESALREIHRTKDPAQWRVDQQREATARRLINMAEDTVAHGTLTEIDLPKTHYRPSSRITVRQTPDVNFGEDPNRELILRLREEPSSPYSTSLIFPSYILEVSSPFYTGVFFKLMRNWHSGEAVQPPEVLNWENERATFKELGLLEKLLTNLQKRLLAGTK